jgi:hypothetical protein
MLEIEGRCEVTEDSLDNHSFKLLELKTEEFESLKDRLVTVLPEYYIDPISIAETLERLGKAAAAQKLRIKIPLVKNIRSGDIGEVLTTDYIDEYTEYSVPIKKLRWRDHRDMAMRGDDVIGIQVDKEKQTLRFLKAEAKANKVLGRDVLQKARDELDNDEGLPAPHALQFVSARLREIGNVELSDLIDEVQLVDGIKATQIEHLLFTFTASNPATTQKEAFAAYEGNIPQRSVGFRVAEHQNLIAGIYQGVIDVLDD